MQNDYLPGKAVVGGAVTIKCLNPFEGDPNRVRIMAMPIVSIPMEPGLETFQSVQSWRYLHPVFP
jgi:hypothetical protein